jgi:catechol 2,3-dioxygenase-like lactoylglutathione lyase family enzyme
MFTYICFGTNNLQRAARFYDAVLGELDLTRCDTSSESDWEDWLGWGTYEDGGLTEVALWVCCPLNGHSATAGNGTMVALRAKSWKEVQHAHQAAIANGGSSEGAPGLRTQYNPDFYAAYIRDPDGNKLAFVCRGFTQTQVA